jgi:putative methanogenesis marker 16 metalloprotein
LEEMPVIKSIEEILCRVKSGEAVVLTATEVCDLAARGEKAEVDVVTTATRAIMSGTYAILSFPVAMPGSFARARKAWINGIPANVGPCPNERLGVLDLVVFGTEHSRDRPGYGGGHLFRDLVDGKKASVEVEADDGRSFLAEVGLMDMPTARLYGTRHAFKNYSAFVNPGPDLVSTIFHTTCFNPNLSGATFSGCGQINPLKNDPLLEAVGVGTKVLINGKEGFVTGCGTRSSSDRPNLSGFADMRGMDPELMGGFITSAGPECICSWAVPIPVVSGTIAESVARLDSHLTMPVMDVNIRQPIGQACYGDVWPGDDFEVKFDQEKCRGCSRCRVEEICPMRAVGFDGLKAEVDERICFNCGACTSQCPGGAFFANMGSIQVGQSRVPVVLRQSDRHRAMRIAEDLRDRIIEGSFEMSPWAQRILH